MPFDFDAAVQAPFRMQPGLRRPAPGAPLLSPAAQAHRGVSRHLREKLAVLWAFTDEALCSVPGFDAQPALRALARHAAQEHPQAFAVDGNDWQAPTLGWAVVGDSRPQAIGHDWPEIGTLLHRLAPEWRRAALLALAFEQDFAVVDARSATIPWLAVALPSMWAPAAKVGRSFTDVHGPVADNRLLLQAADRLVALVTGGERWERFVWTLSPQPRLHAHPQRMAQERWAAGLQGEALAALTWFRSEHQGFLPVPGAQQAVFTIGVNTEPLTQALPTAARTQRLHDALASMSDAVLQYRGLTEVQAPLLRWLADRAATGPAASPDPPA